MQIQTVCYYHLDYIIVRPERLYKSNGFFMCTKLFIKIYKVSYSVKSINLAESADLAISFLLGRFVYQGFLLVEIFFIKVFADSNPAFTEPFMLLSG